MFLSIERMPNLKSCATYIVSFDRLKIFMNGKRQRFFECQKFCVSTSSAAKYMRGYEELSAMPKVLSSWSEFVDVSPKKSSELCRRRRELKCFQKQRRLVRWWLRQSGWNKKYTVYSSGPPRLLWRKRNSIITRYKYSHLLVENMFATR